MLTVAIIIYIFMCWISNWRLGLAKDDVDRVVKILNTHKTDN